MKRTVFVFMMIWATPLVFSQKNGGLSNFLKKAENSQKVCFEYTFFNKPLFSEDTILDSGIGTYGVRVDLLFFSAKKQSGIWREDTLLKFFTIKSPDTLLFKEKESISGKEGILALSNIRSLRTYLNHSQIEFRKNDKKITFNITVPDSSIGLKDLHDLTFTLVYSLNDSLLRQFSMSIFFNAEEQFSLFKYGYSGCISQDSVADIYLRKSSVYEWARADTAKQDSINTNVDFLSGVWGLKDLDGDKFTFPEKGGRNLFYVFDFWYLSCYPCQKLQPVFAALHQKFTSKNVFFYGINVWDELPKVLTYAEQKNITYQVLCAGKKLADALNIRGYPTIVITDNRFKVIKLFIGFGSDTERELNLYLTELIR